MTPTPRRVRRAVALTAEPERVYAFHLDTRNVSSIAPPGTRVEILDGTFPLTEGSRITLRMRQAPLPLWQTWTVRVATLVPHALMVDVAERSPFAFWRHSHAFHAVDGGTTMTDSVEYLLPGGPLVNRLAGPVMDRILMAVFALRHRRTVRVLAGRV